MKNKNTAGILAFFLGGFGVHHFYLGNSGRGVMYLLFFWTFIPAIIAFIEMIILFTSSEKEFNAKYNGGKSSINHTDSADALKKYSELRKDGVITEEEFYEKKKELMK